MIRLHFCSMYALAEWKVAKMLPIDPLSINNRFRKLENLLLVASFTNLFLVAALGILLRSFPFMDGFSLSYKNVVHAHSHFAFGGWLMPVLLLLVLKKFPELKKNVVFQHWRNIAFILLLSSYGMLASFPFMGYKAVSIAFSTLSVLGSFYLVGVIWKVFKGRYLNTSERFLKAGLFYLAISAIGPFATGPLIAMGHQGSPLYFNSIYFYLHFQINGWFVFAIMAFLYKKMEQRRGGYKGDRTFLFFNLACMPAFFLSVLWNQPGLIFNVIGGAAALLQLAGLHYLLKDLKLSGLMNKNQKLTGFILAAFILKNLLQLFSAHPLIAEMAYQNKNFIIAYLHLVLLGFVSLYVFQEILQSRSIARHAIVLFTVGFILTEFLLVLNATGSVFYFLIPYFREMMLVFSLLFPLGILLMIYSETRSGKRLHFN